MAVGIAAEARHILALNLHLIHIFALLMLGAGLGVCFLSTAVYQPLVYLAIHVATNSQVGEVTYTK